MHTDRYLHDLKDFRDLIQVVSNERHILPHLIEKTEYGQKADFKVKYGLTHQLGDPQAGMLK